MCGRTACTLAPDDLVRACRFRNRQGHYQRPVWKDPPGGQQYYPSHNIAPASHTPILLSSKHYSGELDEISERVVQPMKWGLVPKWHKGDPYKLEYETNNCRSEGMLTRRTYKLPLEKGQRCVVLADGFFEWETSKDGKQPYFIYSPHTPEVVKTDVKTEPSSETKPELKPDLISPDPDHPGSTNVKQESKTGHIKPDLDSVSSKIKKEVKTEPVESGSDQSTPVKNEPELSVKCNNLNPDENDDEEWRGKPLLKMAGVFDVWQPPDGSPPLYSYSVLTLDSSPAMAWIHHRMPAILTTDEEVADWLDFAEVPLDKAVKCIHATDMIQLHMVSPMVNNSRNKSPKCVDLYDPKVVKKTASSNLMMNWLAKGKKPTEEGSPDTKKQKFN